MGKVWRISKPAIFTEVGRNTQIITFATEGDKQRVMEGHPWLFDNHMIILKHLEMHSQPLSTRFDTKTFWF